MTAVGTYATLQSAIADTVNRDDLSADVSTFPSGTIDGMIKRAIANATGAIQRDLVSRGGSKNMEALVDTLTLTQNVEFLDFPSDFAGVRAFTITTNPIRVLEFVDPTTLFTQYPDSSTAQPEKYTIIGTRRAYFRPIPDSNYTTRLIYTQQIPKLVAATDTNWVLTDHPDIYVNRAMIELSIYLENDDRLQYWKGIYDQDVDDLMGDDRNVRWAAVPTKPNLQVSIA